MIASSCRAALFGLAAFVALTSQAPFALAQPPGDTSPDDSDSNPVATQGPLLDLAPEHGSKPPPSYTDASRPFLMFGSGKADDSALVRGLAEQRLLRAALSESHTSIGGYGEVHVKGITKGRAGERQWVADIPRLVVFFAHSFNDIFRFYSELELEHSLSCATCPGAIELEQATIDARVFGDVLNLRAGLVIVPMGIINQWHEPPIFHGVARPKVDTVVIPSTWREIGVGAFGQPIDPIRYEIYAVTGLDPLGFGAGGIGGGRQNGGFAAAAGWSITGRLEYEPLLGAVLGVSGYYGDAGPNANFFDLKEKKLDLSVPVIGWNADLRYRRAGLEWRIVYAEWHLPESEALMLTRSAEGKPHFDPARPVPTRIRGAYVEAAYDVLRPLGLSHQLLPFARIEFYDTQSAVPERYQPHPSYSVREYTFGLSYRPIQQIVLKADYQLRNRKLGFDETQIDFGLGFMY